MTTEAQDATEELHGALAVVAESLRLGLPCVSAIRILRSACDRIVSEDECDSARIAREWLDEIFQPPTEADHAD